MVVESFVKIFLFNFRINIQLGEWLDKMLLDGLSVGRYCDGSLGNGIMGRGLSIVCLGFAVVWRKRLRLLFSWWPTDHLQCGQKGVLMRLDSLAWRYQLTRRLPNKSIARRSELPLTVDMNRRSCPWTQCHAEYAQRVWRQFSVRTHSANGLKCHWKRHQHWWIPFRCPSSAETIRDMHHNHFQITPIYSRRDRKTKNKFN